MIRNILLNLFFLTSFFGFSQLQFEKTYGRNGSGTDYGRSFKCTSDGGYILVGESTGTIGSNLDSDIYLVKTNSNGDTIWTKFLGDQLNEQGWDILELPGNQLGRYLILGSQNQTNGIKLTETDSIGNILWSKNYSGTTFGCYTPLVHGVNNGYLILGRQFNSGNWNPYILAINEIGDSIWSTTYTNGDMFYSVKTVSDGYVLAGTDSETSLNDMVFKKIDVLGNQVWRRTTGGSGYDISYSLNTTSDGGFIFIGESSLSSSSNKNICLVKTNQAGIPIWSKFYGGLNNDIGHSVEQMYSGGFAIIGTGHDTINNISKMMLVRTDELGNEINTQYFGNAASEGNCIQKASDGSYVFLGQLMTASNNWQVYFLKFALELGLTNNIQISSIKIFPNPIKTSGLCTWINTNGSKLNFKLYNQFGQLIKTIEEIEVSVIKIEKENLTPGMYYFELSNSFEKHFGKFIIE